MAKKHIRYSQLTDDDHKAIVSRYMALVEFWQGVTAGHATSIVAKDHFGLTTKEWNSDHGHDAFAATAAVLFFNDVYVKTNARAIDLETVKSALGIQ